MFRKGIHSLLLYSFEVNGTSESSVNVVFANENNYIRLHDNNKTRSGKIVCLFKFFAVGERYYFLMRDNLGVSLLTGIILRKAGLIILTTILWIPCSNILLQISETCLRLKYSRVGGIYEYIGQS